MQSLHVIITNDKQNWLTAVRKPNLFSRVMITNRIELDDNSEITKLQFPKTKER